LDLGPDVLDALGDLGDDDLPPPPPPPRRRSSSSIISKYDGRLRPAGLDLERLLDRWFIVLPDKILYIGGWSHKSGATNRVYSIHDFIEPFKYAFSIFRRPISILGKKFMVLNCYVPQELMNVGKLLIVLFQQR
jgi:hypothetical protein